jgi:hypothetical protein
VALRVKGIKLMKKQLLINNVNNSWNSVKDSDEITQIRSQEPGVRSQEKRHRE